MTITITEPRAFSRITNVKCAMAGGTSGSICACGSALDRAPITGVWAKVVALGTAISDPHDPTAQAGSFDQKLGNWWFLVNQLVPNVPCVANPSDNTVLFVVWVAYAGSPTMEEHQSTRIAAKCSTATNCDGTANPCQGIDESRRILAAGAGAAGGQATLETAPRRYQVQGQQARGPLAALVNTSWVLSLRSGGCGCSVVWINEGDGVRLPHVKLRPDNLLASKWHLTLTFNGRRIRYSCSARDWSPLGVNRLVLTETSEGDGLPETLTVSPV